MFEYLTSEQVKPDFYLIEFFLPIYKLLNNFDLSLSLFMLKFDFSRIESQFLF